EDFYAEFQSILTALEYLPRRTETDPERIKERAREKEIIKKRLERRCAEAPPVLRAIEKAVETINGHVGNPRSFDRLDELLNAQSYRLAFWRVAAEEINYRRFFDVNDLAAIRVELPEVFDAAHKLLFELVASGAVTGLRIDHPDGLYRPLEYFEKLQLRCAKAMRISLANEVNVLGSMVDRLSEQNRWFRDYTLEALARAVRETIACFPVYRTYLEPGKPVSEEDRAVIERAVAAAKRRNPAIEESVFNFLLDLLLFRFPENLDEDQRAAHAQFVLKFQQFTGPIMAKGVEDTVFYIYNRLAALNEVGGEPQLFGLSVETFHERNLGRQHD